MEKRDFIIGFRDIYGEEFAVTIKNKNVEAAKAIARAKVKKIFNDELLRLTTVVYC